MHHFNSWCNWNRTKFPVLFKISVTFLKLTLVKPLLNHDNWTYTQTHTFFLNDCLLFPDGRAMEAGGGGTKQQTLPSVLQGRGEDFSSSYEVTWWKSSYSSGSAPTSCSMACCIRSIQGFIFWVFGKALLILPMRNGVSNSWSRPQDAHNWEEPIVHHRWVLLSLVPMSPMPSGIGTLTHLPAPAVPECQAPIALPPSSPCAMAALASQGLQWQGPSSVLRGRKSACMKSNYHLKKTKTQTSTTFISAFTANHY